MSKQNIWAIIGGGNGGQALAGHLALMGFRVRLYDIVEQTIEVINKQGGIHIDGVVQGFGQLQFATTDINEALEGADIVMVIAPAVAHRAIAQNCAPYLKDGQVVILHPGATCGSLEFRHILDTEGCRARVTIAETNSLIYACRSRKPGSSSILGIKDDLVLAAMPVQETPRVLKMFQEAFPQIIAGKNIMQPSLGNANAIMHPAPTLLNTSLIESTHEWLYYYDGISPTIGEFVEALDRERLKLASSFGLNMVSIREWYRLAYGADAPTLSEAVRKNPAYAQVKGQKDLRTRYLLEDIPTGLVPMIELGRMQAIVTERMELVAKLGQHLLGEDFFTNGRTLKNLGIEGISGKEFMHYIETGEK